MQLIIALEKSLRKWYNILRLIFMLEYNYVENALKAGYAQSRQPVFLNNGTALNMIEG